MLKGWFVLLKFIILHRREHRKKGIRGVETVQEHGQTAYAQRETTRITCLNARSLEFFSWFMELIFFWVESKERTGLKNN